MVIRTRLDSPDPEFAVVVRAAVEQAREVSGADIVALYPYDEETGSFYAPAAVGLPEGDLVHALPDIADQLRRFRTDEAEGKTPDELSPSHYGPNAWLLATRRPLVTTDAEREVESSFVRRHKVHAMVGLPLVVGNRMVGLLYLNYVERSRRKPVDITADGYLERVEEAADRVAQTLDAARRVAQTEVLAAISDLVSDFAELPSGMVDEGSAGPQLEVALQRILTAAHLDAAALYVIEGGGAVLVAQQGVASLSGRAADLSGRSAEDIAQDSTLIEVLAHHDLHCLAALTPRGQGRQGVLILAGHDAFTLQRRLPVEHTLLQTATDLLGAMLNTGHLIQALGETNRTLGAVTRLSTRLLRPGVTTEQTLRIAVDALTDVTLPELNFGFADVFLLATAPDGELMVAESAGAATSPEVDTVVEEDDGRSRRVPLWAQSGSRTLGPRDILSYVATRRRAVVVAPADIPDENFVTGYPEDLLERLKVQLARRDGTTAGQIRVARLRSAADRAPLRSDEEGGNYRQTDEFTLDADLFTAHHHAALVRVFVPFGSDASGDRATGVLEAGYHVSRAQRLHRMQIEALRASAATIAVAVETARLYEEVTERAKQLEIVTEVSRAIATSIDLEQTLTLIARNMARAVDASVSLIALLDDDDSAWYGAAASDSDEIWRNHRVERPERSVVFEVADRGHPVMIEDAQNSDLISPYMARLLDLRSLVALPLITAEGAIGAVLLGQRERRVFHQEEIERAAGIVGQAAMAIRNARLHAREEEEHHIQKDVVLAGFGQWGQKAYQHLLVLKNFFNFRIHVVEVDRGGRRAQLVEAEQAVLANGDLFYWDSPAAPAHEALALELEPSCYVISYIATPAETHLPMLKRYYDLSNVVLIEKPLGAPPAEYKEFLDQTDGSVQIVAADHYWFKTEVRLLELLLTEERNLRAFLDEIEEVEVEILEEQPPGGSGAQIGMIADLIPHAFAILSLLSPLDRLRLDSHQPLQIGRYQPLRSEHETYARLVGFFDHRGRKVRVTIDVGKGVTNAKWIKLIGARRMGGRRAFYKFDFIKGEAIDGTQSALRAAVRPIRQPGVPDNAHLSMLRHIVEKKHPAVGILSIREALRANARIQELERMAADLIAAGDWEPYEQGQRPTFADSSMLQMPTSRPASSAPATGG